MTKSNSWNSISVDACLRIRRATRLLGEHSQSNHQTLPLWGGVDAVDMDGQPADFKRMYGFTRMQLKLMRRRVLAGNPMCAICGEREADVVDHIEAVASSHYNPRADRYETSGGEHIHSAGNLRPACRQCNLARRDYRHHRPGKDRPLAVGRDGRVDSVIKRLHNTSRKRWAIIRHELLRVRSVCESCGVRGSEEVDHVYPYSRAKYSHEQGIWVTDAGVGMDDPSNLQALCSSCHKRKSRENHDKPQFHRLVRSDHLSHLFVFDLESRRAQALYAAGGGTVIIAELMGRSLPYVDRCLTNRLDAMGCGIRFKEALTQWRRDRDFEPLPKFPGLGMDCHPCPRAVLKAKSKPNKCYAAVVARAMLRIIRRWRAEGVLVGVIRREFDLTLNQYNHYLCRWGTDESLFHQSRIRWIAKWPHIPYPTL